MLNGARGQFVHQIILSFVRVPNGQLIAMLSGAVLQARALCSGGF
jgi:hypothetical protein